jgi:hypothetical protein
MKRRLGLHGKVELPAVPPRVPAVRQRGATIQFHSCMNREPSSENHSDNACKCASMLENVAYERLASGVLALERAVRLLGGVGAMDAAPDEFTARRDHGELMGLLGRLQDTEREEWDRGSALSWLSPLDVWQIRDAIGTLLAAGDRSAPMLSREDVLALENLATLLESYMNHGARE